MMMKTSANMATIAVVAAFCVCMSVQAEAAWQVARQNESVLTGIAFATASTGFIFGGNNGVGPMILRSTDGGKSFQPVQISNNTAMFMAGASTGAESAMATGLGVLHSAEQYTTDGEHFLPSTEAGVVTEASQSLSLFGDKGYAAVGQWGSVDGVGVSADAGKTVKTVPWNGKTQARYGAFPSATTWFVSGGTWPQKNKQQAEKQGVHQFSQHVNIKVDEHTTQFVSAEELSAANEGSYQATIMKTEDGGKTFTVSYNVSNQFYFNQISCVDESNCVAVGERGDAPVGAYIFITTDGGKTWDKSVTIEDGSLMAVDMLSAQEIYAGGIYVAGSKAGTGIIYHTTNGGSDWTNTAVPGVYLNDFSFVSSSQGFATGFTQEGFCVVATYTA